MSASNGGISQLVRLALFPMFNQGTQSWGIYSFDPSYGFNDANNQSTITFKVEDIEPTFTPTISRLAILYRDLGLVTATFTLSGTNDQQQVVSNSVSVQLGNKVPTEKLMAKLIGLSLTAQNLQLSITRTANAGNFSLVKVKMWGRIEQVSLA